MKRAKVLVVDNDKLITRVLEQYLKGVGFEVSSTNQPERVMKLFEDGRFDVVLLDIVMPKINGIELLKEIKEADPRSIVIMMTAHASLDNAVQTLKLGANDFLKKPFENMELVSFSIRRALKNKLGREEARQMKLIHQQTGNYILSMIDELHSSVAETEGNVLSIMSQKKIACMEPVQKMLRQILSNQFELSRKILNIEMLAQLITNELDFFKEEIYPSLLLKRATEASRKIIEDNNVQLKIKEADEDIPLNLDVDKIAEVLNNIIQNAAIHNPKGISIEIFSKRVNNDWEFSVIDNGKGFGKEDLNILNMKGLDIYQILSMRVEGKGSSLLISKIVVEEHGGEVHFENVQDKSNMVTIRLPIG